MAHSWRRVGFATPPSYQQFYDAIVAKYGENGGHVEVAVKHFGNPANLTPAERSTLFPGTDYEHLPRLRMVSTPPDQVSERLTELRTGDLQMVVIFHLSMERWDLFNAFFSTNQSGVLHASDLELRPGQADTWGDGAGGHATVLDPYASIEGSHIAIKNSWGPKWGDGGCFRVASLEMLQPHLDSRKRVRAFKVVWEDVDIGQPLRERFEKHQAALGASPVPRLRPNECARGSQYIDPITSKATALYNTALDGAPAVIKVVQVGKHRDLKFKFEHPNIIRVLGWRFHDEPQTTVYDPAAFPSVDSHARVDLVLEQGHGDLKGHMEAASLSVVEKLCVLEQVASALHWLWTEHKVVHRDVKPENIIKVGDTWKLADFGIAYHHDTYTEGGRGSEGWTDPLLMTGRCSTSAKLRDADHAKLDVYSLGALIRYLKLDQSDVDCDGTFGGIADKCLETAPNDRPTADDVREAVLNRLHQIGYEQPAALRAEDERECDAIAAEFAAQLKQARAMRWKDLGLTIARAHVHTAAAGEALRELGQAELARGRWHDTLTAIGHVAERMIVSETGVSIVSPQAYPQGSLHAQGRSWLVDSDDTARRLVSQVQLITSKFCAASLVVSNVDDSTMGMLALALPTAIASIRASERSRITDAGLVHLENLTQLQSLDLSHCTLWDPRVGFAYLGKLAQLQSLSLAHCDYTYALAGSIHKSSLHIIEAEFALLGKLVQLQSLNLSHCHLAITDVGLEHLGNLTQLRSLNLSHCHLAITNGDLGRLGKLTRLQSLDFAHCRLSKDIRTYVPLEDQTPVQSRKTDSSLALLESQTQPLNFGLAIRDDGFAFLRQLTQLQSLNLSHCDLAITDFGFEHLGNLTQLQSLNLSHCHPAITTDVGFQHLGNLTQLQSLNLSHCHLAITDGFEHLGKLTRLQSLDLSGCHAITDRGLASLEKLVQLRSLNLNGCFRLSDRCLKRFEKLTRATISHPRVAKDAKRSRR